MSALSDALNQPSVTRHILIEIVAGYRIQNWVAQGAANVWKAALAFSIDSVKFDDSTLTLRASIGLVSANPGSYYSDGSFIYVSPPALGSVFASLVMPMIKLFYSNIDGVLNGTYYEGRIVSQAVIASRIETTFGQVSQVGGGSFKLANGDKFFSALSGIQWSASNVVIKLGADVPGQPVMAYADYETIATWLIDDWIVDDDVFELKLVDKKARLRIQLNLQTITMAAYPQADQSVIGTLIPIAYGVNKSIAPICIDKPNKIFLLCSHAIKSFDGFRINTGTSGSPIWTETTPVSKDLTTSQFTLGADWNGDANVAVDFSGKPNVDGTLMENISDIITDLFANLGDSNIDATAFALAKARLDIGTQQIIGRSTLRKYSAYIDQGNDVLSIIGEIAPTCFLFVYVNANGKYALGVFEPTPSESNLSVDDLDISGWNEEINIQPNGNYVLSDVYASYAQLKQEGYDQVVFYSDPAIWRAAGMIGPMILSESTISDGSQTWANVGLPLKFYEERDARYWAQRELITDGRPQKLITFMVPWRGSFLLPGQFINVEYARQGFSGCLEIYEVSNNLSNGMVKLVCGDLRGFKDQVGFWVGDAPVFPARFATETGYGTGDASVWNSAWSAILKAWARLNVGFWTDDNGFIDSADPESFLGSVWF